MLDTVRGGHVGASAATGVVVESRSASLPDLGALLEQAKEAHKSAYVPYSHFAVGAALQLSDGRVILGANIENASYGLTNCAERTAVFRALMENGGTPPAVAALAVVADSNGPVAPCGACRQVLAEFCPPDMPVVLGDMRGNTKQTSIKGLLPYAFGPAQMTLEG
ncbi:cytidine deaminase [Alicyclobacillus sp. ALC3]|uniref:cytidine deaminase n=1 Tax=Alicyclobacillus sp. ALC3 TaxID=2796143 RepID=UPI00237845E6|nr:cytidine deaminase [Alicyclobacillus sp. ALC3]